MLQQHSFPLPPKDGVNSERVRERCCVRDRGTLRQPQSHHPQLVWFAIRVPKGSTDCKTALAGYEGGFEPAS